jgi:septum formation protein
MSTPRTSAPHVVLASASPRRRDLLARLGIDPDIRPARIDEAPHPGEGATDLVRRLASMKAAAIDAPPDALVVAADTEVVLDGQVLGKPADDAHATAMLAALSGRTHDVLTGVAVRCGDRAATDVASTRVHVRPLDPAEIDWYVRTGEPMGKAGAYAIQGAGAAFIDGVDGSDTNVIGLPLALLVALARRVGVNLLA